MKTIEERAKELYPEKYDFFTNDDRNAVSRTIYIDAATEQRAIDIKKAKEWIANTFPSLIFDTVKIQADFVKFMEE